MVGGAPASPFPGTIPEFVVPLPLPTVPMRERLPVSEFSCEFLRVNQRGYTAAGEWMFAVEYSAATVFGTIRSGLVANAASTKIDSAVARVVTAVAMAAAIQYAYLNQSPPLPLPPNPGMASPLSRETADVLDGTARFRGFCSGLRALDPDLVDTVTVFVPRVFAGP